MKCKYCKSIIESGSIYCRFCGERLIKSKREIAVPKPKQRADGTYFAQMMVGGERFIVDGDTEAEYYTNARAVKIGALKVEKTDSYPTLYQAMALYISADCAVLSPSTRRGYWIIARNRFKAYAETTLDKIDFQQLVNDESLLVKPKTVKNGYSLVTSACRKSKYPLVKVKLPKVPEPDTPWLNYKQIEIFLKAAEGEKGELEALLALHSLRESELLALTFDSYTDGIIHVRGAVVPDENNALVYKETNKTSLSTRDIPVIIPRLEELLSSLCNGVDDGKENSKKAREKDREKYIKRDGKRERKNDKRKGTIVQCVPLTVCRRINAICVKANLPLVGCHGLRRSFVSLAYHLGWDVQTTQRVGGWDDIDTIIKHYKKLSELEVNDDIQKMRDYYKFTKND